jgi:outer membrane protein assembly factor BamB
MSTPCAFTVIDRQLLITDPATGQVRWHGSPLGLPVEEVRPLLTADRAIVLLDYMAGPTGPRQNLICVDCDGQVVWQAALPSSSSPEAFVSFELVGDQLFANSWSGWGVAIDPLTGDIRGAEFTK